MIRAQARPPFVYAANFLPGGGGAFPRETSIRCSDSVRVWRGGWSIGVEDWDDNTTFQSHIDANGYGLRFVRRSSGDYTKRWNWTSALLTSQMAELADGPVVFGFYPQAGAGLDADITAEILETKELLNPIYSDTGYYSSGNEIIATTTFAPSTAISDAYAPTYITASLSDEALGCAVRLSGAWGASAAGADVFVTGMHFGRGYLPPIGRATSALNQFNEAASYSQSTYSRGTGPGQADTIAGSLLGRVMALDGTNLGVFFNYRFNTPMTPVARTYSPKSGTIGGCYNETQAIDDIPIDLYELNDTGVSAWLSRASGGTIALGDRLRVHIEAGTEF